MRTQDEVVQALDRALWFFELARLAVVGEVGDQPLKPEAVAAGMADGPLQVLEIEPPVLVSWRRGRTPAHSGRVITGPVSEHVLNRSPAPVSDQVAAAK